MAEYIDKAIAIQICADSWDTSDASADIKDEPPADVIERETINKAIEEMENIELVMFCDEMRDYCVEILKKHVGGE